MLNNQLNKWIKKQNILNNLSVKKLSHKKLKQWNYTNLEIAHKKKIFFKILPFEFKTQNKRWFQPLIIQKEEGILGIIKKRILNKEYYLFQAKAEPGNINNVQISPTVQATKSNYLKKHGGKKTLYLEYFLKKNKKIKILSDLRLSEQGTRFFNKKNRNILIEIQNLKLKKNKNFIWLSKKELKFLLKKRNILNMDSISVFSSIIKKNNIDNPLQVLNNLIMLIKLSSKNLKIKKKIIKFSVLKNWIFNDYEILDKYKKFFSIFFIKILAKNREVKYWDQPIISDHNKSLNVFIISKINETNHYLLKVVNEPGFVSPKFTATISEKNFSHLNFKKIKFHKFLKKRNYLLNITNSDEGGRFYKNQTANIICHLNDYRKINFPKSYIWASHNQIIELINKNLLTIEARNLFACFNIDKIK